MDRSDRVEICLLGIEEVTRCNVTPDGKIEVEIRAALQCKNEEDHDVIVSEIRVRFREPKLLHATTAKIVGAKRIPANATVRPRQGEVGDWLVMEFKAPPDGSESICDRILDLLRQEGMEVEPPESNVDVHWG